jgi:hypothetical protein
MEGRIKTSVKQIMHQIFGEPTSSQMYAFIIGLIIFSAIVWGGLWWYSLPKPATFTIVIESDTDWRGVIGSIEEGARSVSSSGYKSFKVWGTVVTAVVQKETVYGYLRVSIYRDGKVVASQETIASYGVVSVSAKT